MLQRAREEVSERDKGVRVVCRVLLYNKIIGEMKGALLVGLFVLSQGQLLHKSNADHDLLSYGDFGNRINQNNLPSSEDKQSVSSIGNLRQPRQLQ